MAGKKIDCKNVALMIVVKFDILFHFHVVCPDGQGNGK